MAMQKTKTFFTKKSLIILMILLVIVGALGYFFYSNEASDNTTISQDNQYIEDGVNYRPPTEEEKTQVDQHKDDLANNPEPTTPSSGVRSVTPVITNKGQIENGNVEVASYVPGIFEEGGICTLTLTHNNQSVTATNPGTKNVSNVSCGYITIERNRLSTGIWNASITYSSPNAKGTSQAITLEVN